MPLFFHRINTSFSLFLYVVSLSREVSEYRFSFFISPSSVLNFVSMRVFFTDCDHEFTSPAHRWTGCCCSTSPSAIPCWSCARLIERWLTMWGSSPLPMGVARPAIPSWARGCLGWSSGRRSGCPTRTKPTCSLRLYRSRQASTRSGTFSLTDFGGDRQCGPPLPESLGAGGVPR